MECLAIFTGTRHFDLELQIIVHTASGAKQEVKDLKAMGCDDARAKPFKDESAAYDWYEANR